MIATTLRGALAHYTLYRTLSAGTVNWYSRVISVYCHWAGGDVPLADFNGDSISRLLLDKEQAGRSPYYLKSLRGGLVAFLREIREGQPVERVRSVRTPPLEPHALSPAEVERLLAAVDSLPPGSRPVYRLMIGLGYFTGLDAADILKLERRHIAADGSIFFRRGKTGSPIFVRIPPELVAMIDEHCPRKGQLIRLNVSREWFRRVMARLFERAGLQGSFKTLRKSAGSLVEQQSPGTGHRHLGNTRAIFERHYESKRITRGEPTMPPPIRLTG